MTKLKKLEKQVQRGNVAEKIIMNEQLNATDFNILLEIVKDEFKNTFGYLANEEELAKDYKHEQEER